MENLKDTKTADLIAEWVWLDEMRPIDRSDPSKYHQQCDAIAAELDRRCTLIGIHLIDGSFGYSFVTANDHPPKMKHKWWIGGTTPMPAKEQHDLEGWLLLKEGGVK